MRREVKPAHDFVALSGQSRGGELVLLLGSLFPDKVSAVIGYVPSALVHGGQAAADPAVGRDGPAWLERAREQLDDDWMHTPRLSALARNADVHPVYFSRAFRRRFGCSPGEYLRHCRMERAIGLLHDPNMGLAQVAVACGFVDQSHFTHAFRRNYRCTPAQYRARA